MNATERFRRFLRHAETRVSFREVLRRDPCVYCAVWPMPQRNADRVSIEHITPTSEGGENDWRNLAVAHCACNESRSSVPLLQFFVYRQQVMTLSGKQHKRERHKIRRALRFDMIARRLQAERRGGLEERGDAKNDPAR